MTLRYNCLYVQGCHYEPIPSFAQRMNIWAIADIHLALSYPEKTMEDFGPRWKDYTRKLEENWKRVVGENDLVLVPGDISWARSVEQAKVDLDWLGQLPGKKIMIRGNHDSWWQSLNKIKPILPPNVIALQNDAYNEGDLSIGGARLWETSEYSNKEVVEFTENPKANPKTPVLNLEDHDRIYEKELGRLELSLQAMNPDAKTKIFLTHFPPLSWDLKNSRVHEALKKSKIDYCIFGHLHNIIASPPPLFGEKDGISYIFVAADYLHFEPKKIL